VAAKLVEDGQLSWTEPISTYIPEFSLNDELASRHTTMLDLLTHRTVINIIFGMQHAINILMQYLDLRVYLTMNCWLPIYTLKITH
jgi:hypothetical protein